MPTIELINQKINERLMHINLLHTQIHYLCTALDILKIEYKVNLRKHSYQHNLSRDKFLGFEQQYNLESAHILNEYFTSNNSNEKILEDKYFYMLESSAFLLRLNEEARLVLSIYDILRKINDLRIQALVTYIDYTFNKIKTMLRDKLLYENDNSHYMSGDALDDNYELLENEDNESTISKHEPNRHYKRWIDYILCLTDKPKLNAVYPIVEAYVAKNDIIIANVYDMRSVLKKIKLTVYNKFTSYFMRRIMGIGPPQLSYHIRRKFEIKFNKIINILESIKEPDDNRKYAYFIYKIIEDEIAECTDAAALAELVRLKSYIHLKSENTIIKHDQQYMLICNSSDPKDKLKFRPTIR